MTAKQLKALFRSNGVTVRAWAAANGFRAAQVYAVLNERTYGHRGEAHRIALALGIKQLDEGCPVPGAGHLTATSSPAAARSIAVGAAEAACDRKGTAMSNST